MPDTGAKKDFFISYNKADRAAAEWIAWQLEELGKHTVVIQAWDFGPASNFGVEMQRATEQCERVLCVLSPDYLTSLYTLPEWIAYFTQDPTSEKRKLLPVRVRECELKGLLAPIVYLDLFGRDEPEATKSLLDGVKFALAAGTLHPGKPATKPGFFAAPARVIPSKPEFFGALPEIWNVPHLRNPNFTEPGTQLADLRAALAGGHAAALTQALAGLGGVGKTSLAVEYVYRHASEYSLVWWLRAEEPAGLAAEYAALAAKLGLPEATIQEQPVIIAAVKDALRHQRDWLLIFDNANSPEEVRPFLPGGTGHVLITSRHAVWSRTAQKVQVKKWASQIAINFLLKRTNQSDVTAAVALTQELDSLPLALEQAAAFIEATGGTLAGYLILFRQHRVALLNHGTFGGDYPATVSTTWDISFQKLERESPVGAALLNLCAFFAPNDIPRTVILAGAKYLPEPLRSATADALAVECAVAAILRFSLVEAVNPTSISLHCLVQAVIRYRLGEVSRQQWAEAALQVVNSAFPKASDDVQTWGEYSRLLPHAEATAGFAEEQSVGLEVASKLISQMGAYAWGRAEYTTAKIAYQRVLGIAIKTNGPNHPEVAINVNNLGNVLQALNDLFGAKAAYEHALSIAENAYGPDHPELVTAVNNLGLVMQDLGDLTGAKAAFERALRIDEEAYGHYHPAVATDANYLGMVLKNLGDLAGAKAAFERALRIDEKAHGPDHPMTAIRLNNLGIVMRALGDLAGAKTAFERALEIDEGAYGFNHPEVATDINNLGGVLWSLGDSAGARVAGRRALAIWQKSLGADHPNTKIGRENLAAISPE